MNYSDKEVAIAGIGAFYPEKKLTNADLMKIVDTNAEWIVSRTGICERRVVEPGQTSSDLGAEAAGRALRHSNLSPDQLTYIIMPTVTPDTYSPAGAAFVAKKMGAAYVPAMDMNVGCSGMIYAMEVASSMVTADPQALIMLVCSEVLTSRTNWHDRSTCVLFGDGASAFLVGHKNNKLIKPLAVVEDVILGADATMTDCLTIRGGASSRPYTLGEAVTDDFFIKMQGQEVYRQAVRKMEWVTAEILARNNMTVRDVDFFIPHQANKRIIEAVGKKLNFNDEQVVVNVDRFGNTSSASTVIALDEWFQAGRIKSGSRVLQVVFGAGFSWGAAMLKFV